MIARIALCAICRPKLAETFLTPSASALERLLQARLRAASCSLGRERLRPDLEALVRRRPSTRRGPG